MSLNCGHLVEEMFSVPLKNEQSDFIYRVSAYEYLAVTSSELHVYMLYS
jgi:hypothetical protein